MTQGDGTAPKRDFEAEAREWDRRYREQPHELPRAYRQLFALEYRVPVAAFFFTLFAVAGFVSGSPVSMIGSILTVYGVTQIVQANRRKRHEPYFSMTKSGSRANAIQGLRGIGAVLAGLVVMALGVTVLGWSLWFGDL